MSSQLDNVLREIGVATVLVKLRPSAAALEAPSARRRRGRSLLAANAATQADILSCFVSRRSVRAGTLGLEAAGSRPDADIYPHLGIVAGLVDRRGLNALRERQDVESVTLAPSLSLVRPKDERTTTTAAQPAVSWGIDRMDVPNLWSRGLTGAGVIVGHLDTGIDGGHLALQGAIKAFAQFDNKGRIVPGATPTDSDRHGTHTAGTIAARPFSGRSFGVAPGATLASGMVIEGGEAIRRILAGMEWVIVQKARILNLSLGLEGYWTDFEVLIDAVRRNGVLPVVAVGNEGEDQTRSPGNYSTVLSVGALDKDNTVADFSGSSYFKRPRDPRVPDIIAPGVDVASCVPGGGLKSMKGTSMATPHVSGLAALLMQARPSATLADVERAILTSAVRPPSIPEDRGNRGVPSATAALEILLGGSGLTLSAKPYSPLRATRKARSKMPAGRKARKPSRKTKSNRRR